MTDRRYQLRHVAGFGGRRSKPPSAVASVGHCFVSSVGAFFCVATTGRGACVIMSMLAGAQSLARPIRNSRRSGPHRLPPRGPDCPHLAPANETTAPSTIPTVCAQSFRLGAFRHGSISHNQCHGFLMVPASERGDSVARPIHQCALLNPKRARLRGEPALMKDAAINSASDRPKLFL